MTATSLQPKIAPTPTHTTGDSRWFVDARFGLFIHWGLYSLAARHEQVLVREKIPPDKYDLYFRHFDPDLYDPQEWAENALKAGVKYFVLTAKHHDGFCLWDSELTDYKVTNTPIRMDVVRATIDAFRSRHIKVGLYYSLIDWHHPHFLIDQLHPLWDHPDRDEMNAARDQKKYIAYLHGQVRELLSDYGAIDDIWFDYSYPAGRDGHDEHWVGKGKEDWQSDGLLKLVRTLQPGIMVNDRLDLAEGWDYTTPEQHTPRQWVNAHGRPAVWEACHTFSGSWGYHRDENSWKSTEQLITILIDTVSKGGNLLLNVGPTGRGEFDSRSTDRLRGMGQWLKIHGRAIYGCTQAPSGFVSPQNCRLTYNPTQNRLYVHVLAWPCGELHLDGFAGKVRYAQLLNDASEVIVDNPSVISVDAGNKEGSTLTIKLPIEKPGVVVPVIELFLNDG